MTLRNATDFLESPLSLRAIGVAMVAMGLLLICKGLFGDLSGEELWWGYVGVGVLSLAFSALFFIFASASAEMGVEHGRADNEISKPESSEVRQTSQRRTLH